MISWSVSDTICDIVATAVKSSDDHISELHGCNAVGLLWGN